MRCFLLIFLLLPQILVSYNYNEILQGSFFHNEDKTRQVIFSFFGQTDNSRRTDPSFDYKIRFVQLIPAPIDSIPVCQHTSAEWFKQSFRYMKPSKILENHLLYKFSGFRAFIKTLSGYKEHIQKVKKKLLDRKKTQQKCSSIFD